MYEYIKSELQPVIEAIRDNKFEEEKYLLDATEGMKESGMPNYSLWKSKITLKTEHISVPEIYSKLKDFLPRPALNNLYLPILNDALRKSQSNKQIVYFQSLQRTPVANYFYGNAMLLLSLIHI